MAEEIKLRCMSVAFAGLPNAGKSTLFNKIIGNRLSIVSPREQTTRNVLRGILVENSTQLIFVDTPGIFLAKKSRILEKIIVKNAWSGIETADLLCVVIDSVRAMDDELASTLRNIVNRYEDPIFILNKIDRVQKDKLLELAKKLSDMCPRFREIFMVSAQRGENVDRLRRYLLDLAPESPWLFGADEITDVPMRFRATEITREKLFLVLRQDLPYSLEVVEDSFENLGGSAIKIHQTVVVLKESQKAIVVGKSGSMLKNIGIAARKDMERLFGKRVHLFLFVRVKSDWIREKSSDL
ncbi:MAG: GTPase Era [Rickettsiales bacterium]|jgi:GTP-binding protein Era|nr:GTPase Era [Rickettsiales bacterium]